MTTSNMFTGYGGGAMCITIGRIKSKLSWQEYGKSDTKGNALKVDCWNDTGVQQQYQFSFCA